MFTSTHNPRVQDSPNHQKIVDITEKFKRMNQNQENERKLKITNIESSFNELEKEVGNTPAYETKFRMFRDELGNLQEKQNDEKQNRYISFI